MLPTFGHQGFVLEHALEQPEISQIPSVLRIFEGGLEFSHPVFVEATFLPGFHVFLEDGVQRDSPASAMRATLT